MSEPGRRQVKCCAIVPAYREAARIGGVVAGVLRHVRDVIVVDDGSGDETAAAAGKAGALVVQHPRNMGKGAALNTGFETARGRGFDVMITLDADGQHGPDEIPRFIEAYVRTGIPVLIGNRMWDTARMPLVRRLTNRFMSWLLSREMGQYVADTQCGFRLYRGDVIPFVSAESQRFAAESEILLHIAARGIRMDSVPISTIYRDEKSKINPLRDALRFFDMLARYRRRKKRTRVRQDR
jgi:glycosyltransferase involved in cell wall biosynthesis